MRRNTTMVLTMWALLGCAHGEQNESPTSAAFTSTAIDNGGEETGAQGDASSGTDDGDDDVPVDPEGTSSSNGDGDDVASTGMGADDESSSGGPADTGGEPVPDVGPWEDCAQANCADDIACLGLDGVPDALYCAPDCVDDADCIPPAGSDATALCAIVTEGDVPSHCALLCSLDGQPQGDCPPQMACTPMPGASPPFSLCVP